jgi:hypothetical protein
MKKLLENANTCHLAWIFVKIDRNSITINGLRQFQSNVTARGLNRQPVLVQRKRAGRWPTGLGECASRATRHEEAARERKYVPPCSVTLRDRKRLQTGKNMLKYYSE